MQPEPKTLVDLAYATLRSKIIDGTLGPGEKLRVEHLREQLGIGATPLREALSKLAAERLVRSAGQRGFRVAPMSIEELDDLTENRALLESRAMELSVKNGDVAWEARVVAAHHTITQADKAFAKKKVDVLERERRNEAFHAALISACGSPWLLELRGTLYDQLSRYRALSLKTGNSRDVAAEHDAIVEAALARQSKKAAQLVADHVRATATALRPVIDRQLGAA